MKNKKQSKSQESFSLSLSPQNKGCSFPSEKKQGSTLVSYFSAKHQWNASKKPTGSTREAKPKNRLSGSEFIHLWAHDLYSPITHTMVHSGAFLQVKHRPRQRPKACRIKVSEGVGVLVCHG